MRRGEVLELPWGALDFDNKAVHITQALKTRDGQIGKPKWEKERRTFLPEKTADALRELRKESDHVLPTSLIFCWADGQPRLGTWWRKAFERAMIAAGFLPVDRNENGKITKIYNPRCLRPHSFRHSMATLLRDAGTNPDKLRASFGWTDPKVMEGYTHWQQVSFEEQRTQVDKIFGK
jgi:integrase